MDNRLAKVNSAFGRYTNVSGTTKIYRKTRRSMSAKLLCWPLSCMVLSPGHLSSPPPSHRALPSALPTYHPKHPLEWFRHQHRGPSSGYVYQHWSHARQNTASLDRTCLRDRKPSPIKDHDIWRTSHWPSWQRDTSEKIQTFWKCPSPLARSVDNTINKSHELVTHLFL